MVTTVVDEVQREAVITPPLALEGGLAAEHRPPSVVQQLFSLFKNVRPGSDVTGFQLPSLFSLPKSQLQCYGESVYCIGEDYLRKCAKGKSSLERFTSVVAWSMSTNRPALFGQAPFNPVLGETHHVSRGSLNVLLEQVVSHHPPVSALHATDTEENIEMVWCHYPIPRFHGTYIEASIKGKRELKLLNFGENYEMNSPNLFIKLFPAPGADWLGNVNIRCKESGLEADLCYHKSRSFLGFGGSSRSVKGKIFHSKSLKTIYEIYGQWDRTVTVKDIHSGETKVIYDGKQAISKLETPTVKDPKNLWLNESVLVWSEVSKAIMDKDWKRAGEKKKIIEEKERQTEKERLSRGETWVPKHFIVSHSKENEWYCTPVQKNVPPAPIVVNS